MTFDGRLFSGITVLVAVAESGSFVRAAEALGLSSSGVSRAISRLESRVGVRLLDRTTRSLTLTDEGRQFYNQVGLHLEGLQEAVSVAAGAANTVRGRLRVNVDPFFCRTILASRLPEFLDVHPEMRLELIMRDDIGDLVADGFDLAVRFGPVPVGSFVAKKLAATRIITVASPEFIAKYGRPTHPDEVANQHRILFYNPVTGRPFEWLFCRARQTIEVEAFGRLLVSDVGTMLNCCVAGGGVAQVMALGTEEMIQSGELLNLFPDWPDEKFPLYAIYPSKRHTAAKVKAFIDFCVRTLKKTDTKARASD